MMKRNKVYIGLSGGVDSSVAAWLLKEKGYEVTGFTLKLWRDDRFGEISEIPVEGMHRPFIGRLSDGRLFLSYREFLSPISASEFKGTSANLKACIFTESELIKAEHFETHLIDTDQSENPDQGYSAWVQLDDGEIVMANYITDDAPKPYIRGYRISNL